MAAVKEITTKRGSAAGAREQTLAAVNAERVVALEQGCVRIPSDTFAEGPLADYFANYMEDIGLDVSMIQVVDPFDPSKKSREPVGRLRGTGGGKSLMLDGHMDHNPVMPSDKWEREPFSGDFDGTYIYGRGAQDDKGGIVAAISAAEALIESGVKLKGDLFVCPVAAHKSGGFGTLAILRKGIRPDFAINLENSGNGLATITVGALKGQVHAYPTHVAPHILSADIWPDRKDAYLNRNEQIARVVAALGPAQRVPENGWLTYETSADLPDFPVIHFDNVENVDGRVTLEFHLRTVPGMTRGTVTADLERVFGRLRADDPNFNLDYDIPPKKGKYGPGWDWPPVKIPNDHPLPKAVIAAHRQATGSDPVVGADPRLGNVGDASFLQRAGIPSVLYGPGDRDMRVDERVSLRDLEVAAKVYAVSAIDICGLA